MNIKEQHTQAKATKHRIWLHSQYLITLNEQQTTLYAASRETREQTETRISATKACLEAEALRLLEQTNELIQSIEDIENPRLQEILTRRYLNNQPFAAIAEDMNYDLRWVYRLHHQGLMLSEFKRPPIFDKTL